MRRISEGRPRIPAAGTAVGLLATMVAFWTLPACEDPTWPGNRAGLACPPCPLATACVDDPRDGCDPANGGRACPGVCASTFCGGIAGTPCPDGLVCVDDPRDGCDPATGGADCAGLCAPGP